MNRLNSWAARLFNVTISFLINFCTLTRWYGFQLLWKGPVRSALRGVCHAHWHSSRPVCIRAKRPNDNTGFDAYIVTCPFGYLVVVDKVLAISPHLLLHEMLHLLLKEEQYPLPFLPDDVLTPAERQHWLNGFGNALHHPEIYRRSEMIYGLPMAPIWAHQRHQSMTVITRFQGNDPAPGDRLLFILFTFFWVFVPEQEAREVLTLMESAFREEYIVCISIRDRARTEGVDLYTSAGVGRVADLLKEECLDYSRRQWLPPRYDNAIRGLRTLPMQEMPEGGFGD